MTDKQVLGIARGGGLNLLGQVCSQVAMLVVTVLLARQLGREDVGRYAQASAILSLLGLVSLSGLRTGLTRFVAVHLAEGEAGALRGTVRLGIALTTGAAALLGLALYLAAPGLAHGAFHDQGLALPLQVVALVLPAATFTDSALAATQGFRTMKPFALVGLVFEPLLRVGLSAALIAGGAGLGGALAAMAVSNLAAAAAAAWALRRLLRRVAQAAPTRARLRELLGFSLLSWGASLASSGLVWADTILIGALRSSAEVGVYNVATRLVTLATFVMPAINGALGPRIANLHHRHQTESLRRAYAVATSWILRLFGDGFREGAAVAAVLAAGKLADAGTGPCGLMLNMSGRPLWSTVDNLVALVLNVVLNLWLIPTHGILGAAMAWALALAIVNLARVVQVWCIMRMLPFDLGVLKGVLAGAGALAAGLLARQWVAMAAIPLATALGLVQVGVVYLALLAVLGIGAEDRLVLRTLLRRVRDAGAGALTR